MCVRLVTVDVAPIALQKCVKFQQGIKRQEIVCNHKLETNKIQRFIQLEMVNNDSAVAMLL